MLKTPSLDGVCNWRYVKNEKVESFRSAHDLLDGKLAKSAYMLFYELPEITAKCYYESKLLNSSVQKCIQTASCLESPDDSVVDLSQQTQNLSIKCLGEFTDDEIVVTKKPEKFLEKNPDTSLSQSVLNLSLYTDEDSDTNSQHVNKKRKL